MPELPAHSPLTAADLICNTCGKVMKRTVVMNRTEVDHIDYTCQNEATGCSYKVEAKLFCSLQTIRIPSPEVLKKK
jgi:lysyl-tRNA synthetase class I